MSERGDGYRRPGRQVRHAFISYVREDSSKVDQLQRTLEAADIPVWRDTADLWPGEDWRWKIRQAIQADALAFIACFSEQSLARPHSFQRKELKLAIEEFREHRPGEPWLIPVRFSDCDIPALHIGDGRTLRSLQRVDLFGDRADEGAARLIAVVLHVLRQTSDTPVQADQANRRRGTGWLRLRWIAPTVVVALAVAGLTAFRLHEDWNANYSGPGKGYAAVAIHRGDTAATLAARLVSLGVVAAANPFIAASGGSASVALQPGYVRLHRRMRAALAYAMLLKPSSRIHLSFTVPAGFRSKGIAGLLSTATAYPVTAFTKALADKSALGLPPYTHGNIEGYLFPGTYRIQPNASPAGLLQEIVQGFSKEAANVNLSTSTKDSGSVENRIIIIASLVQAEGGTTAQYPQIARVIYNRLYLHWLLRLSSTVAFARGIEGTPTPSQDQGTRSTYNTFLHRGLPPGPIGSPGDAAIKAALHPANGRWVTMTVSPQTKVIRFSTATPTQQRKSHNGGGGGGGGGILPWVIIPVIFFG